ncbi:MAG: hypothetical protein WC554_18025 [Clostridia bacterium]|jgi:hypothetical protein
MNAYDKVKNEKGIIAHLMNGGSSPSNQEESNSYANALAKGNYPAGLDGCFTVGISGGCGMDCFVMQNGNCKMPQEVWDRHKVPIQKLQEMYDDGYYENEIQQYCQLYGLELKTAGTRESNLQGKFTL